MPSLTHQIHHLMDFRDTEDATEVNVCVKVGTGRLAAKAKVGPDGARSANRLRQVKRSKEAIQHVPDETGSGTCVRIHGHRF